MEMNKELKSYKQRNNYNQEQMANLLAISRSYYAKLENGTRTPTEKVTDIIFELMPYLKDKNKLDSIFDWVSFRVMGNSPEEIIEELLKLKTGMFIHEKGMNNYTSMYANDNIKVLFDEPNLTNKGVNVFLSGNGCRSLERYFKFQERTWFTFLDDCTQFNAHFTRVDLAINDYYKFLSIPELINKVNNGECISKFQTHKEIVSSSFTGDSKGASITFGGNKSDFQIIMYEKNYEQAQKLNVSKEYIDIKNRYELRFYHDYADQIIQKVISTQNIVQVSKDILGTYIKFENYNDWNLMLEEIEELKLTTKSKKSSLEQTIINGIRQYGSAFHAQLLKDNTLGTNHLLDLINETEISDKHNIELKNDLSNAESIILWQK